ncbi:hypothetical protein MZD04_gp163 [Pseudomonas phage Psa21]|uniref:Uncharacterized protein n=1 Tax=Pseudomonas phage Psa21 TaxID=2530023 RepID=A0A481W4J7_9CAUD|nr:hypothetical protein MZD04_gp163 [Pseudomonas phage Psa21]QBJ02690.1 hypothetical protein PSA21_163 [Pseudomonas phage Psa21]
MEISDKQLLDALLAPATQLAPLSRLTNYKKMVEAIQMHPVAAKVWELPQVQAHHEAFQSECFQQGNKWTLSDIYHHVQLIVGIVFRELLPLVTLVYERDNGSRLLLGASDFSDDALGMVYSISSVREDGSNGESEYYRITGWGFINAVDIRKRSNYTMHGRTAYGVRTIDDVLNVCDASSVDKDL